MSKGERKINCSKMTSEFFNENYADKVYPNVDFRTEGMFTGSPGANIEAQTWFSRDGKVYSFVCISSSHISKDIDIFKSLCDDLILDIRDAHESFMSKERKKLDMSKIKFEEGEVVGLIIIED